MRIPYGFELISDGTLEVNKDEDKKVIESIALQQEAVIRNLEGKEVKKVIVVPGKIVNIVAK